MVINMVTDIKQTCLGQGLGVTFTARKRPSKLMFTMKDLGHALPGRQIWTFASNSRCYYFKKKQKKTKQKNPANHSVKQLNKFAKLVCLYKLINKRAFFQSVVWVVKHKINPFNIKAVMLDIPEPSMLELRMQTCAGSSEPLSHYEIMSVNISIEPVHAHWMHARIQNILSEGVVREPKCH